MMLSSNVPSAAQQSMLVVRRVARDEINSFPLFWLQFVVDGRVHAEICNTVDLKAQQQDFACWNLNRFFPI
jgi:hypothetical protein